LTPEGKIVKGANVENASYGSLLALTRSIFEEDTNPSFVRRDYLRRTYRDCKGRRKVTSPYLPTLTDS